MAVKIRLKRMGQIRAPFYRVVVADSRSKRDGRAIEEIGLYNPMTDPSTIEIKSDRAQYWLGVGAQPTEQVAALLKVTGDWQKFKNLPGTEGTYRVPAANTKPPRIPAGGVVKTAETPAEAPAADAETPAEES
ncbi:30S ribosomal protein S16 [Kineococcus aurantiacus]|uniref:Small ribosomal subunit protein bS16 n=1 Tax=Kineococcus aurantiacus TaxID=37633 RepID=A0A7Y9DP87_9ACTN|nr:small subunit ribosomal protein S16 [Kineococcus aurantiacus]